MFVMCLYTYLCSQIVLGVRAPSLFEESVTCARYQGLERGRACTGEDEPRYNTKQPTVGQFWARALVLLGTLLCRRGSVAVDGHRSQGTVIPVQGVRGT